MSLMDQFVYLVLGVVCTLCAMFMIKPQHASCPPGWWLPEGIRRSGVYVCRPTPIGDTVRVGKAIVDQSVQPTGYVVGQIFCEPNAIPTIVDTRSVACSPNL